MSPCTPGGTGIAARYNDGMGMDIVDGCSRATVTSRLAACGFRISDQRLRIASILLSAPQHLSAEQIAEALRREGARVSKATVYNTLNLFAARGLIRQLTLDGSCAWFYSNVAPHYHFHDEQTC